MRKFSAGTQITPVILALNVSLQIALGKSMRNTTEQITTLTKFDREYSLRGFPKFANLAHGLYIAGMNPKAVMNRNISDTSLFTIQSG